MLFRKENIFDFGIDGRKINENIIGIPFLFRHIAPQSKVLDVGCTGSPISLQLAIMRYNVTGIDYEDYGFGHANMKFIKDNFISHDFGKEKFDVVIAMNSIEHFGLQYYNKSELLDKQADVKAMTKIKELIKVGGQLIFTCKYGIQELINASGKPFVRIYDEPSLDVLLSTFEIKNSEYYMVSDYKSVRQVPREEAAGSRHYRNSGTYAIACINAIKK
jgi:hypothetical protein